MHPSLTVHLAPPPGFQRMCCEVRVCRADSAVLQACQCLLWCMSCPLFEQLSSTTERGRSTDYHLTVSFREVFSLGALNDCIWAGFGVWLG